MRYRYFQWDDDLVSSMMAEQGLMQLFNYLLLQTNGDVDEALSWMEHLKKRGYLKGNPDLSEFRDTLQKKELIQRQGKRHTLTTRGEKWVRQESLDFIFRGLKETGAGSHPLAREGAGPGEALPETRPFEFGDAMHDIDFQETYRNALRRGGIAGLSSDLHEDDLAVHERQAATSAATVLLLDISHSMTLYGEDRITPAKQVAMALAQLIKTQYPKDTLEVVTFGDEAQRIDVAQLPYISNGPYHTNTQEGLRVGRELLLRSKCQNRQIFMITDGKPSVVRRRNGELYINSFGLDPYIVDRTLDEAMICRKKQIVITTFMIASDPYLQNFIKRLTELNRGRCYFAPLNNLGGFIFRDFMTNRQKRAR